MHRALPAYSYPQQSPPSTHRYSGTSSAFSASANPNEDWTKISDLAERRRIQNRIAQRNYRKKLKKRLEDLERRAASNSASPEQRPAELHRPESQQHAYHSREAADSDRHDYYRHHEHYQSQPYHPVQASHEEHGMFSQRNTRQLSTSPPPFSYSTYPAPESVSSYATYTPSTYQTSPPASTAASESSYSPYLPPLSSAYPNTLPSMVNRVKQEYYHEEEISPFSMSYASMAGIDIPAPAGYASSSPQTPPLSRSFEASAAGSPSESVTYPVTPGSTGSSPPMGCEQLC